MHTGGLAPLPGRLGGSPEEGVSPAQFNRLAVDSASLRRVRTLFVVSRNSVTKEVFYWLGVNGDAITDAPPSAVLDLIDNGVPGTAFTLAFRDGTSRSYSTFGTNVATYGQLQVIETSGTEISAKPPTWTDYGGSEDKRASKTEGDAPFAWAILGELRTQRGSAYGKAPFGYLAFYDIACARQLQLQYRLAETHAVSGTPATAAGERLSRWASWLTVLPSDTEAQARAKCVAQYSLSCGANSAQLDVALRSLLGGSFVSTVSNFGTMTDPPEPTYWPGAAYPSYWPAPPSYDLGTGVFLSARSILGVIATKPVGTTQADWDRLVGVDLRDLLKDALPATQAFSWSDSSDGFILDSSRLDEGSL